MTLNTFHSSHISFSLYVLSEERFKVTEPPTRVNSASEVALVLFPSGIS